MRTCQNQGCRELTDQSRCAFHALAAAGVGGVLGQSFDSQFELEVIELVEVLLDLAADSLAGIDLQLRCRHGLVLGTCYLSPSSVCALPGFGSTPWQERDQLHQIILN